MRHTSNQEYTSPDPAPERKDEPDLHPLTLTKNEALFIDDMLSLVVQMSEFMTLRPLTPRTGLPASVEFIEKIAHAVLFTTDLDNVGKEAVVQLDTGELWMLRDISQSNCFRGVESVGYNLKRKIYAALCGGEYNRDKIAGQLLSQIDSEVLEQFYREHLSVEPAQSAKNNGEAPRAENKVLVYAAKHAGEPEVVFVPKYKAIRLAQTYKAWHKSTTWGEFRSKVSSEVYEDAIQWTGLEIRPRDEDLLEMGAMDDGDWPTNPQRDMLHWMPDPVKVLGVTKPTVLNGDYLCLHTDRLIEMLSILSSLGYTCIKDESLVRQSMDLEQS